MAKPQVLLLGFLDTKEAEHRFVKGLLEEKGCKVVIVDTSIQHETELSRQAVHPPPSVCSEVDTTLAHVRSLHRAEALKLMTAGALNIARRYEQEDQLHGIIGMGGSTTTALVCDVMRDIKIGVPKICVSTMASGDTRPYIGDSDICLMPSIADISGSLNVLSTRILTNATSAMAGMAHAFKEYSESSNFSADDEQAKHLVAVTMFGLTTPGVNAACERLRSFKDPQSGQRLYEPVVFHCTGSGGRTMERLIAEKWFHAVLDLTTTELADEQCGGILSAGPTRLTAAGKAGIPQVVSLGALDMCNFGPRSTVPEKYAHRTLYEHNSSITLLRTSPAECRQMGCEMAKRLSQGHGPLLIVIPKKGWSGIDVKGGPFWDPEADKALVDELKDGFQRSGREVDLIEAEGDINDKDTAHLMADKLNQLMAKYEQDGAQSSGFTDATQTEPRNLTVTIVMEGTEGYQGGISEGTAQVVSDDR
ncbi:UPF0261-domain-containing protein [Neolentinus lepideus HHB14362 ss-1]|uniref:UPF0261-domain-containing protein n=1 Tax=Neolentinus lepideus HHB14362 ss-1 TaxID=1314782 RepID=A0A165NWJ9_9AGAM|nr:UPF0261-domain-containing protein [Neolentinus lepideus HHB14362 ss-1]